MYGMKRCRARGDCWEVRTVGLIIFVDRYAGSLGLQKKKRPNDSDKLEQNPFACDQIPSIPLDYFVSFV